MINNTDEHMYRHKIIYIFFRIINMISSLLLPIITQNILDYSINNNNMTILNKYALLYLSIIITFIVSLSLSFYYKTKIEEIAIMRTKKQIVRSVSLLNINMLNNISSGFFIERFNRDVEGCRSFIIEKKVSFIIHLLSMIIILIFMFSTSVIYSIFLVSIFPLFYFLQKRFVSRISILTEKDSEYQELLNSNVEEVVNLNYTLRANNATGYYEEKVDKNLEKFLLNTMKKTKVETKYDYMLITGLLNMASFIVYYLGGLLLVNNRISVGMITSFSLYYSKLWNPIQFFMDYPKAKAKYKIHYNRIKDLLESIDEDTLDNKIIIDEKLRSIKLDNLTYKINNKLILSNISLEINHGDKIGIVGSNGSGKSTIANIIAGLITNYEGNIYWNNKNYKDIDLEKLREKITLIPATADLLNTSIEENITLELPNKIDKNLLDNLKKNLNINFLDNKKNVLDKGSNLSSGEAKIIQLARGIYRNGDMFILDEPINFIDKDHVENIMNYLDIYLNDKTVVIISHDLRALSFCDKVYKLERHKLIEYEEGII